MLNQLFTSASVLNRLHIGLFAPYLEPLAYALHQQGYSPTTIRNCLYATDKFGQ